MLTMRATAASFKFELGREREKECSDRSSKCSVFSRYILIGRYLTFDCYCWFVCSKGKRAACMDPRMQEQEEGGGEGTVVVVWLLRFMPCAAATDVASPG
jgi:hypothetical protein